MQGAPTPEQKSAVKRKEPSAKLGRVQGRRWKRAKARFQLSTEELAMAKAAGFPPVRMDEAATGQRRSGSEKLPPTATPEQIALIKRVIRERYAIQTKRQKERASMTKLTVMVPTDLKAHVGIECARAGLMLDEEIQALLMARFPRQASPANGLLGEREGGSDEA